MQTFLQDLKYAIRLLIKAPSFTAVALGTLALGIAANAAIFSIVNALLIKPLPYAEPHRLVMLWQDQRARGGPENEWLAPAHFFDWRNRATSFEASTVFHGGSASLTGSAEPEQVRGWRVTADFFKVLGVAPALGRDFRAEDDRPGAAPTVILTHGLWIRRFGADPSLVGRTIALNRVAHTVIGVLPSSFTNPFASPEIFRPAQLNPVQPSRGNVTLQMIARLKRDVAFERAQAEMSAVGAALAAEHPATDKGTTIRLTRLHEEIVGDVRTPLLALFGAVLLVLLIACANVAGLQLARASARVREIAIRAALGAGRARIVRQLLTESVVIGLIGATAGVLLSSWMLDGFTALAPEGTARLEEVRIDGMVLAFAVVLAVATSAVFGLAPAMQSVRTDVVSSIKEGVRSTGGRQGTVTRGVFVAAQLALALTLLVGAGLLMRSLANIRGVDPGFDPERLLAAFIGLPANGYETAPKVRTFQTSLLERVNTTPGVSAAALVSVLPFSGDDTDTSFFIEGKPQPQGAGDTPVAWYRIVSAGYLRTIGMQMESGRFIAPGDLDTSEAVVVINRTLANRYWPNENPIGRRIRTGKYTCTIVGVVRDVHHRSLREDPRGEMFLSYQQFQSRGMYLAVRTAAEPTGVLPSVRRHLASLDPNIPLFSVATMDRLLADSLSLPRMMALLMGAFAAASVVLSAIGVYGLMAYTVTLRTQEFGIRMALGAARSDILRLVVGQAGRLTAFGLIAGAIAALAAARFIRTMLFGVTSSDVPTFIGTALVLGGIALLASYLPARRAVRVDPVTALRSE
jgi:putative ABC transport system permease protein